MRRVTEWLVAGVNGVSPHAAAAVNVRAVDAGVVVNTTLRRGILAAADSPRIQRFVGRHRLRLGAARLATGHYPRIEHDPAGALLLAGADGGWVNGQVLRANGGMV